MIHGICHVYIYTTSRYILKITTSFDIFPVVAFDQPLWLKVMEIVSTETVHQSLANVIILLGNFHTQISFSIGYIMENSGLSEIFEICYAKNSIKYILNGKADGRAVCAHNLLSSILSTKICRMALIDDDMKKEASDMFQSLMKDGFNTSLDLTFVDSISQKLENVFPNPSRQFKLRLQYVRMINILRMSKAAERTGNWEGYPCVLRQMIPFLAALGHNHYTRSVRWFLQNMLELPVTHSTLYSMFMKGFFVAR